MSETTSPRFLTLEYHLRFFPFVIWRRIRSRSPREGKRPSFVPYGLIEIMLLFAASAILIAIGLPPAWSRGSIPGWIALGTGLTGILGILILSIVFRVRERRHPSYDEFLIGIFFFSIAFGLTAGLFLGSLEKHTPGLKILEAVAGLAVGYGLGIFAGLYIQYLGLVSKLLDWLALPALVGIVIVDLVLLFG